jgi:mannose-6-phosphate isomerase-like protein (cupin superfamily)
MLHFGMAKVQSRRNFLRSTSLAAAAITLPLAEKSATAEPTAPELTPSVPFKLVTAPQFTEALATLKAKPGNFSFFDAPSLPFTCVMTLEQNKSPKEFEWHEGRDHIVQILDGSTVIEVGGTPQGGHNTKPGEWLAPTSQGATALTLNKGDILIIPRNTPHKRTTAATVTLYLFSTTGNAPS